MSYKDHPDYQSLTDDEKLRVDMEVQAFLYGEVFCRVTHNADGTRRLEVLNGPDVTILHRTLPGDEPGKVVLT